jgi:hypothetical protein
VSTIRPISEKQREANRRNASQSTGPKTEAGKQASRMNAVTHGLLAKTVAITAGDYQEDEQEFGQLLEDLREQFTPVGVAEDLEIQKIALCYWRKMRAVRYEHGAIRKRTGDMREREELSREQLFDLALSCGGTEAMMSRARRSACARAVRGRVVRSGWRARISARTILTKSRRRAAFGTSEDRERVDTW